MKTTITKYGIIFAVFVCVLVTFAADKPVIVHKGFATGRDYLKMNDAQKRAYAMGAINGMLLAPLFGAPKDRVKWFESYVEKMTDDQVAAILTKYVKDNPGRWHDGLHILTYSAIIESHTKSRGDKKK
ncbi:hypothetical protein H8E77_17805 [bacterium]|nr:hypothetical protein [bacterium]